MGAVLLFNISDVRKKVKLKAVVTGHNKKWTALRLHQELLVEAMTVSKKRK